MKDLQPMTREEVFLAKAAGYDISEELDPMTRKEWFLNKIKGGGPGPSPGGDSDHSGAVSSTSGEVAAKVATTESVIGVRDGDRFTLYLANDNTAPSSVTLAINDGSPKPVKVVDLINGSIDDGYLVDADATNFLAGMYSVLYDGTNYVVSANDGTGAFGGAIVYSQYAGNGLPFVSPGQKIGATLKVSESGQWSVSDTIEFMIMGDGDTEYITGYPAVYYWIGLYNGDLSESTYTINWYPCQDHGNVNAYSVPLVLDHIEEDSSQNKILYLRGMGLGLEGTSSIRKDTIGIYWFKVTISEDSVVPGQHNISFERYGGDNETYLRMPTPVNLEEVSIHPDLMLGTAIEFIKDDSNNYEYSIPYEALNYNILYDKLENEVSSITDKSCWIDLWTKLEDDSIDTPCRIILTVLYEGYRYIKIPMSCYNHGFDESTSTAYMRFIGNVLFEGDIKQIKIDVVAPVDPSSGAIGNLVWDVMADYGISFDQIMTDVGTMSQAITQLRADIDYIAMTLGITLGGGNS